MLISLSSLKIWFIVSPTVEKTDALGCAPWQGVVLVIAAPYVTLHEPWNVT
jgi:hypothetical protein